MIHTDAMNNRRAKTSLEKYTSQFICKARKGCVGFYCERELETEQRLQYIEPHSHGRQRCVFLVLQGCSTGGPAAQLSTGWWLSLLHLISNFSGPQLIRGPEGPFGLVWLSLPHLVSNSNSSGAPRAPSAWRGFPYHISSLTPTDL